MVLEERWVRGARRFLRLEVVEMLEPEVHGCLVLGFLVFDQVCRRVRWFTEFLARSFGTRA